MAVYSLRDERPIVVKQEVKTGRKQGQHSKEVQKFVQSHTISVKLDSSGRPIIIAKEAING